MLTRLCLSCPQGLPDVASICVILCAVWLLQVGGICNGFGEDPFAKPGYFPLTRGSFVQCTPVVACLGGKNATCSPRYTGDRCAQCNLGCYRHVC